MDYNAKQREYRRKTGNAATQKYEKTKQGKLMRTYRNMQSRVTGILKKKAHLYEGLDILSREEFYEWSLNGTQFHLLYDQWVASEYKPGMSPSVERVNPEKGYTIDNMEWITHSENSRRAAKTRERFKD